MDCIDHPAFIARTKTAHPEQCPAGLTRDPIYLDVMWVGFHCAVGTTYESWSGKRMGVQSMVGGAFGGMPIWGSMVVGPWSYCLFPAGGSPQSSWMNEQELVIDR